MLILNKHGLPLKSFKSFDVVKPGPVSLSILPLALLWLQEMQAMSAYVAVGEHLQRVACHSLELTPTPWFAAYYFARRLLIPCSAYVLVTSCGVKLPLSSMGVFPAELGLERSSNVSQSLFFCC